jgi:hypothetical protein
MAFGKKSSSKSNEEDEAAANYVDMGGEERSPTNFVTEVPKKNKGLTGGLSSMFKREGKDGPAESEEKVPSGESSPRRKTPEPLSQKESVAEGNAAASSERQQQEQRQKMFFGGDSDMDDDDDDDETATDTVYTAGVKTILRYRGFSTSIKEIFLDEALVCSSIGCFGLFLSNRTEYLLQLRNDRRGVRWGRSSSKNSLPSRIVAYALLLTLALIAITFCIWGFGEGNASPLAQNWYDGYDRYQETDDAWKWDSKNKQAEIDDDQYRYFYADDDGNGGDDAYAAADDAYAAADDAYAAADDAYAAANDDAANGDDGNNYGDDAYGNRREQEILPTNVDAHRVHGIFKIRDMDESLWQPAISFLKDEWNRPDERKLSSSSGNSERSMASDVRVSLILAFLIVLGILGRRRRMRTRYYLVRARAQEDHLYYASAAAGIRKVTFQDSREDQYEGACSHTLCGCYPIDPPTEGAEVLEEEIHVGEQGVQGQKKERRMGDVMSRGFSCLMGFCCGVVCKFWCQCLSICALAQEAREIRLLVPTRYQRLDFITHQPFSEYYKGINDLRRGWLGKMRQKSGIMPHFDALSKLSRYILIFFAASFCVIALTLAFNPRATFSWPDMVILAATFGQSFLVLLIVHWIFHKSDLSLDAVIKFYAAGFLIAVPSSFFFEGILVNLTLMMAYFVYWIGEIIAGEKFTYWVIDHYKILWVIGEFVNAYIVAAITEELCKYYTFRTVEHPDLIFLTGLQRSSQDERAIQGGMVKYPFGPHQIENSNRKNGTSYDEGDVDRKSQYTGNAHRTNETNQKNGKQEEFDLTKHFGEEDYDDEEEPDVRTYRQKAAAVTTAMISVAVGLACAENFLYVFFLGGLAGNSGNAQQGGIMEEWLVLLFRSLFPVHALAAAMQSVNVIRKFIECRGDDDNHRIGVGRIVLPAILMHGTFDAVLLAINVYIETVWDSYLVKYEGNVDPDDPPYNATVLNVVAFSLISAVVLGGLIWYYREQKNQNQRLIIMDQKEKVNAEDGLSSYKSPSEVSAPPAAKGDIELV